MSPYPAQTDDLKEQMDDLKEQIEFAEESESPRSVQSKEDEESPQSVRPKEDVVKNKYLWKLGMCGAATQDSAWKPREERPKQHCTLIIFDWDDTLLPTSAIMSDHPPSPKELEAEAIEALRLLTLAKTLGTVLIITNAQRRWVQQSCTTYLPALWPCLKDVEVISARDKFEKRFPDDPTQWKVEAFCEVKENSGTIANLIALGDSTAEMDALHAMAKLYHVSYTKTLKFKERPRCTELQHEQRLVAKKLDTIVNSVKNYTIKLQRVKAS